MTATASGRRVALAAVAICVIAFTIVVAPASASRNLVTGFAEPTYRSSSDAARDAAFATSVDEKAGIVRIDVIWRVIAGPSRPVDPTNPSDPGYDFSGLDPAVKDAAAHGLDILFTVYSAPSWAEGPNRPPVSDRIPQGTWKPDPQELGDFAEALGTRYSGSFVPGFGAGPLPRVRNFEAWNEENLWAYLTPQYEGTTLVAADQYRRMLDAFYTGLKSVRPDANVVLGGNAPYGDPPGDLRTRPLLFLKQLFCLSDKLKPKGCAKRAAFDILGVHPINLSGGPTVSAINDDDASSADLPNVVDVLRAAEKHGTIKPSGRHDVWVTEFWWESYPDGPHAAIPGLKKHAIWIEQAMYLFWKAGAKVAINLQLYDTPASDAQALHQSLQTGMYFEDGSPKPAATSFRFPFVLEGRSNNNLFAWGKAPDSGKLTIETKAGGGWRKVGTVHAKEGKVFTTTLKAGGKGTYRARVGGNTSRVWSQ
jgi:hypothetical protein